MPEETNRSGSIYGGAADPCAVILFGASRDLAKRKVIPAMYDLAQYKSLGERYAIIGFARTPMTDDSFRSMTGEAAWSLVDPILDVWSAAKSISVPQYASGTWGPRESDQMLERESRQWYNP
jgi:glucose-6-phosphate 1-dehydrogenase